MFIPIDAKADITGSKKGKLTPAQHAQINAWCLANKTGIFDCLDRCEAEQNSYTAVNNIANIVFKKGYLAICGRIVECEAGTEVQVVTPASGSVSGRIIARYNLASSGEEEFIITTTTRNLVQQDLNNNPLTGVYEFELYSYTATPTLVTLTRNASYVPDIGGKLSQFEASLKDEGKPLHGYDDSKGTIEERLTKLGFKTGSIILSSGCTASNNVIRRQGNYCLFSSTFTKNGQITNNSIVTIGTIPKEFAAKSSINGYVKCDITFDDTISQTLEGLAYMSVLSTGEIQISNFSIDIGYYVSHIKVYLLSFGYEAQPL